MIDQEEEVLDLGAKEAKEEEDQEIAEAEEEQEEEEPEEVDFEEVKKSKSDHTRISKVFISWETKTKQFSQNQFFQENQFMEKKESQLKKMAKKSNTELGIPIDRKSGPL